MASKKRVSKLAEGPLFTLTEVSKKTGISMPTLQRYKKRYQDRIPSEGKGRRQRYPEQSLAVFEELRKENLGRRGRPRKDANAEPKKKPARQRKTAARRKPAASRRRAARGGAGQPLTLTEIGKRTGISYPTLLRYVKLHGKQIPQVGKGRARRYPPQAVEVFARLRGQSRRGRRPKMSQGGSAPAARAVEVSNRELATRIQRLEAAMGEVNRRQREVLSLMKKPLRVTISS